MRELRLVREGSTGTSLVLTDDHGEQFLLPVDEGVRQLVAGDDTPGASRSGSTASGAVTPPAADTAVHIVDEASPSPARSEPEAPHAPADDAQLPPERRLPEPDPLHANPLTMRPREIQTRIRAGASVQELADEMNVAPSRLDPYAHPVLLERAQIAELARSSHPVREDGPAKLTLSEVLSAAFGARGHSLSAAQWDAFREPDGEWVIRVSWQAGLSENEAEWTYRRHSTTSATTEPRNAVAADLTDPDFVQPVRSLTSVSRGTRYEESLPAHSRRDDGPEEAFDYELDGELTSDSDRDTTEIAVVGDDPAEPDSSSGGDSDDFLRHPDAEEDKPAKRRRKAVTPHWEDVLLGVRTNTKRPKK